MLRRSDGGPVTGTAAAAVALAVYLLGLATAFGWRTLAHWRATGSTGYRGISGRPGSLHWWGGVLFAVALALGVAAPVLTLAGVSGPDELRHPVLAGVGLIGAVAGVLLTLAAQRDMGASWRIGVDPGERTALVTGGLFARVRNPIFTGMLAVTAGLVGMVPTAVSVLALVCFSPRWRFKSAPLKSPTSPPPTGRRTGAMPPRPAASSRASGAQGLLVPARRATATRDRTGRAAPRRQHRTACVTPPELARTLARCRDLDLRSSRPTSA